MSRFDLADHDRRLAGIVRVGRVEETTGETVRVRIGPILTQPLPVAMPAAGRVRAWAPPSIGEQVLVLAPGGEPDGAIAIAGIYSDAAPAPSDDLDETLIVWPDGARAAYHSAEGRMTVELPAGARLDVTAPGGVHIEGDVIVSGDVVADGVSLKSHVHGGVRRGDAETDKPS
jgi:phage baseplate assembly protein V